MQDAARLESLARRFPAMEDALRERAEKIRTMRMMEKNPANAELIAKQHEEKMRQREKERADREKRRQAREERENE